MKKKILLIELFILSVLGKHKKKAEVIKKSHIFKEFGNNCYWHPIWLPTEPNLISIGDNVTVSADVRFYEHDLIRMMFDNDDEYYGPYIDYYTGPITVEENVVIGARSVILYNVTIGRNSVIAAGSVVTKDVPPYSIVGGNPAKVIGDTKELLKKRLIHSKVNVTDYDYNQYFKKKKD